MPVYEYYCERCDKRFEALRPMREAGEPVSCPTCGREARQIMPTSFAAMSWQQGYPQRVPFHHRPVRQRTPKKSAGAESNPTGRGKRNEKKGKAQR